eukprot:6752029-Prymnesium_polylepis.1
MPSSHLASSASPSCFRSSPARRGYTNRCGTRAAFPSSQKPSSRSTLQRWPSPRFRCEEGARGAVS